MKKAQQGRHVAAPTDSKTKSSGGRTVSSRQRYTTPYRPDGDYTRDEFSLYEEVKTQMHEVPAEPVSGHRVEAVRERGREPVREQVNRYEPQSVQYYRPEPEQFYEPAPEAHERYTDHVERVVRERHPEQGVPSRSADHGRITRPRTEEPERARHASAVEPERRSRSQNGETGRGSHSKPSVPESRSHVRDDEPARRSHTRATVQDGRTVREQPEEQQDRPERRLRIEPPKNKALFIAGYICILLGFICGAVEVLSFKEARVSETENRMLQGFPELSAESVVSGTFMSEMESYLSDAFFFRDEVASFTEQQLSVFAVPDDGPETWDVDLEHLDAPVETSEENVDADSGTAETLSGEAENNPEETAEPAAVTAVASASLVDESQLSPAELYLTDSSGNKRTLYTFNTAQMTDFAQMLNNYRAALPENGTLHYAAPPVSAFANNILVSHKYTGWGTDLDDVLNSVVDDGIHVYDIPEILTPYLETSRLYPINDHHWHPLSASLTCQTMLANQGIASVDYYEYRYYVTSLSMRETVYGDELKALSLPADTIEIMEPLSPVQAFKVKNFDQLTNSVFIDNSKGGLISYLGGLQPGPWRMFITGFHTGRNAVIITDSFGLTFTPYLIPYYDVIIFADLRESCFSLADSGGTIREYIEYYNATDMYMLSSAYAPDIVSQVERRLHKYLG